MTRDEQGYNGWKNRSTWNVVLWINNDEGLYRAASSFMQGKGKTSKKPYVSFIDHAGLRNDKTGDGIKYISSLLDYDELNDMMREMI